MIDPSTVTYDLICRHYLCSKADTHNFPQVLVWKEIRYGRMSEKEKSMLVSEVNILRELKHPNIVRYKVVLTSLFVILSSGPTGQTCWLQGIGVWSRSYP